MPDIIVVDEDGNVVKKERERRGIDGKTIAVGGGIVALILFLLLRGRGSSGGGQATLLLFKLTPNGLSLNGASLSLEEAVSRVLARKQTAALLQPTGDARQGDVDFVIQQFQKAGVTLSVRQQLQASFYRRGLGGQVA